MNYFGTILIVSCLIPTILWSQEKYPTSYEVQYQVEYSIDSLHPKDRTTETVYLYTGPDYGVFMNYNHAHVAEQKADYEKQMRAQHNLSTVTYTNHVYRSTNFNKTFFKDLQTHKVVTIHNLADRNYRYTEPIRPAWHLKDSTSTFLDYPVHKATTQFAGRDYVAWFTLQIPIHDGPYLFAGLPGLIVELYDTEKDYVFKLQSIQKLDSIKVWTIPDAEKTTKSKVRQLIEKLPTIKAKRAFTPYNPGNKVKVIIKGKEVTQSEYRRIIKERWEKKNNRIELK